MDEQQIRAIIHDELSNFLGVDRYIFDKNIQVLDGRNVQVGRTAGMKIGTAVDQKIALYGKTPIIQQNTIATPTAPGATYSQAEAGSAKTAIDSIRTALINFGITA